MKTTTIVHAAALLGAVVILGVAALTAGGVDAARGGKHGSNTSAATTSSISLDQADPHLGDLVTFTTSDGRLITVACYQDGVGMVYAAEQPVGTEFLLGGTDSAWLTNGGGALCYAWVYSRNLSDGFVAATSFVAGGAR